MVRRFFIPPEKIVGKRATLCGPEVHHLQKVMRLQPGDAVALFDGTGNAYQAAIVSFEDGRVHLDQVEKTRREPQPSLTITLAQGYLKDKKMDSLVRPLTELGLARWIPCFARRSVPAPDEKRLRTRLARWRKLSLEALKQCRRNHPMIVEAPLTFNQALDQSDGHDVKVIFWEQANPGDCSS